MSKRVKVEVDDDLVQEYMSRTGLICRSDAVHLALRTLLSETDSAEGDLRNDEFDEFSDPAAWRRENRAG